MTRSRQRNKDNAADKVFASGDTGFEQSEASDNRTPAALPLLPSLTAIAELVVIFAAIIGIDWLAPNLGVLDMQPRPFWLPVLLLSLQYGTVSGLLAAGAAIVANFFSGFPEQDIGENHFAFFLRVWGEPILWIAAALTIGQFRMQQLAKKQELLRENRSLIRQRDNLARHASDLRDRCTVLEREIAAQHRERPFIALAELAMLRLERTDGAGAVDPDQRAIAILDRMMKAAFPGARAALFRRNDAGLVEIAASGRAWGAGPVSAVPRRSGLAKAIVEGRRRLSVLEPGAEEILKGVGIMAVPVLDGSRASATGMLVVEHCAPAALSAEGLLALDAVAGALSDVMAAADPSVHETSVLSEQGSSSGSECQTDVLAAEAGPAMQGMARATAGLRLVGSESRSAPGGRSER